MSRDNTLLLMTLELIEDSGAVTLDLAYLLMMSKMLRQTCFGKLLEITWMHSQTYYLTSVTCLVLLELSTITPLTDQFGSFDMEFVVVDSHGQTDSEDYHIRSTEHQRCTCYL